MGVLLVPSDLSVIVGLTMLKQLDRHLTARSSQGSGFEGPDRTTERLLWKHILNCLVVFLSLQAFLK